MTRDDTAHRSVLKPRLAPGQVGFTLFYFYFFLLSSESSPPSNFEREPPCFVDALSAQILSKNACTLLIFFARLCVRWGEFQQFFS